MPLPRRCLAALLTLMLTWVGCGSAICGVAAAPTCIAVPDVVELGHVGPRGTATGAFTLHNGSSHAIEVAQVQSSCPCLQFDPMRPLLLPGASQVIRLRFDAAVEPGFCGKLLIDFAGFTGDRQELFQTRVAVIVDPD